MYKELVNPPDLLKKNPFDKKKIKKYKQLGICAIIPINSTKYKLQSFSSKKQLPKHAIITHYGKCGTCSSTQDLAIYKKKRNLTDPIKRCALRGMLAKKWNHKCVKNIGFSKPCAQVWFYNSQNTLKKCWKPCLKHYFSKNNISKSKLNPCLQCDENINGPIFKRLAGRTRRNSGIKSSIQRSYISKIKECKRGRRKRSQKCKRGRRKRSQKCKRGRKRSQKCKRGRRKRSQKYKRGRRKRSQKCKRGRKRSQKCKRSSSRQRRR